MKNIIAGLFLLLFPSLSFAADNVVVLLDTSGSMDERMRGTNVTKMEAAREALCSVVDRLGPNTQLGIVTFEGWLVPLGPVNKDQTKELIRKTIANGGTPLGAYSKQAADALIEARKNSRGIGTFKLLVVTDGEATDSGVLSSNIVHIKARGIVIEAIGVGMSSEHTLSQNSKTYMPANDPEALKRAVAVSVAEVSTTGDGLDEESFKLIAPLPDDLCKHVITALASPPNTPIGEAVPVYTVDADGKLTTPTVDPVELLQKEESSSFPVWLGIVIGIVIIVGIMILVSVIIRTH